MRMWLGWALAVAVFCSSSHASGERRVALVVGNGSYKAVSPLRNPIKDANLMRRTLKGAGFEVTMVLDAGDKALRKAVIDFGLRLEDADVGLFYYAGHGIQLDGANYLVPTDAKLARRDYLEIEALNVNNVLKRMGAAGNRLNIVVLDACRNNPFPAFSRAPTRGLAVTRAPSGTYIAYATRPGDVAVDGQGANSPFTAALARAIPTPGASLEQVFKDVRSEVRRRTGGMQIPWTSSSIEGEFRFHKKRAKATVAELENKNLKMALKEARLRALEEADARRAAEIELKKLDAEKRQIEAAIAHTKDDAAKRDLLKSLRAAEQRAEKAERQAKLSEAKRQELVALSNASKDDKPAKQRFRKSGHLYGMILMSAERRDHWSDSCPISFELKDGQFRHAFACNEKEWLLSGRTDANGRLVASTVFAHERVMDVIIPLVGTIFDARGKVQEIQHSVVFSASLKLAFKSSELASTKVVSLGNSAAGEQKQLASASNDPIAKKFTDPLPANTIWDGDVAIWSTRKQNRISCTIKLEVEDFRFRNDFNCDGEDWILSGRLHPDGTLEGVSLYSMNQETERFLRMGGTITHMTVTSSEGIGHKSGDPNTVSANVVLARVR